MPWCCVLLVHEPYLAYGPPRFRLYMLLILYILYHLYTYECTYLVSVKKLSVWYAALDKTVAPLSNAGWYIAFIADILFGDYISIINRNILHFKSSCFRSFCVFYILYISFHVCVLLYSFNSSDVLNEYISSFVLSFISISNR